MRLKRILAIVFMFWAVAPLAYGLAGSAALEQVQQTVDAVIATLQDKGMETEARRQKLSGLVRARFDFETMSQWVLGPSWRKAEAVEKSRFMDLFSDLLEATYLGRIEAYTDEKVFYAGEKIEGDRALIDTFVRTAGADIPISYKLVRRGDQWLVYDVVIEEISLVRNYRSTYNEIIRREGMSGLFTKMEEKIKELKASGGQG